MDELNPARVDQFVKLVRAAHAAGTTIEAFEPPMNQRIESAREHSQVPRRMAQLVKVIEGLQREGVLRFHPRGEFADLGADPSGFSDGVHPTRATSTRILLRVLGREHGCGM
jgi:hypothetical protein